MSSDDIILIVNHGGFFEGYWVMGDFNYKIKELRKQTLKFKVKAIEEAILKAQEYNTEYGYRFVNLKLSS
jgi:hypothetical protein